LRAAQIRSLPHRRFHGHDRRTSTHAWKPSGSWLEVPGLITFAFYGRVGQPRLQDVVASKAWQLHRALALIEPHSGVVVQQFFDAGVSRALPWQRRPQASRLLAALRDAGRGFDAVVIGEPQRAFYGNQFSLTYPVFEHFGVQLWVPEVGGPIDPGSEAHDLAMTLFGSQSKGERMRIKTRVRAAMGAQTALQGRFLGGRPPYGYRLIDAGPHPNPAKARLGARLHALEPDPATARWSHGSSPCSWTATATWPSPSTSPPNTSPPPSGHDRVRNPHRLGVAWSKSAVRAILANPRYTGYQIWNKQRRDEVLLDIDDVAAGHISRMRWNPREQWIWPAEPTHPALVSRETFDQVQARVAARSPTSPRAAQASPRPYALRGRLSCGLCRRRLQGQWVRGEAYYRCRYPSEYAQSAGFDHPVNVYLREADLLPKLDAWLARLVSPTSIETTCRRLATAHTQPSNGADPGLTAAQQVLADCQRKLARHRAALEAGGDPTVINQWIAEVTQQQRHAQHTLDELRAAASPDRQPVDPGLVRALLEELGDLAAGLDLADPGQRAVFYQEMGISGLYQPANRIVLITAEPDMRRRTVRVGGPTGPLGLPKFTTPVAV
jgi:site-specific DNA recombinase